MVKTNRNNILNSITIFLKSKMGSQNEYYTNIIKEILNKYEQLPEWEKDHLKKKMA